MQDYNQRIIQALGDPTDLVVYHLPFSGESEGDGACIFLETLVDRDKIERLILKPLLEADRESRNSEQAARWIKTVIPIPDIHEAKQFQDCIQGLLGGNCLLLLGNTENIGFIIDVQKTKHRSISEPTSEVTVRGPREGFNEDLATNISLVRKRIKNQSLRVESLSVGELTKTKVVILYLEDIAANDLVNEIRKRINSIKTDSILESSYIEEWIQGKKFNPFPTVLNTERPDVVVSNILEGRIAILTDGTPMALIGPITFFQLFSTPEDYYQKPDIASLLRILRLFSFLIATLTPSVYIAVVTYHQALLPTSLLISLSAQREGVPFPGFIEALMMQIVFEILREAGLRMPRIAGQAISIVGALVIGEAAVQAGLVSAAMVIVVSLTAIANFVTPAYSFGITQRLIQFSFILLAGFMGMFGILWGVLLVLLYLASLDSFSIPYLSPFAPTIISDWKDTAVRAPQQSLQTLPKMLDSNEKKR